ncbi:MAG: hypothetical protein IH940_14305 [Acidobacteria bacterium]|nr:hypothetical protein [Acidobacteriota bacterium]
MSANGLTIVAPGLPEGEVRPDGDVLLTLVRSVGWLSRNDLASRPIPAGPEMVAPGAQTLGVFGTEIFLTVDDDAEKIRHAGAALRGVLGGPDPLLYSGRSMLELEGDGLVISALKPSEHGEGIVVRVLNVTTKASIGRLRVGFDCETASLCRLDETNPSPLELIANELEFNAPAHGLVTIALRPSDG